jgi:hypothetical protein
MQWRLFYWHIDRGIWEEGTPNFGKLIRFTGPNFCSSLVSFSRSNDRNYRNFPLLSRGSFCCCDGHRSHRSRLTFPSFRSPHSPNFVPALFYRPHALHSHSLCLRQPRPSPRHPRRSCTRTGASPNLLRQPSLTPLPGDTLTCPGRDLTLQILFRCRTNQHFNSTRMNDLDQEFPEEP